MQSQGKKNKQQLVKEVGDGVGMRWQEERGVEGGLVCSCWKQKQMIKSEGCWCDACIFDANMEQVWMLLMWCMRMCIRVVDTDMEYVVTRA